MPVKEHVTKQEINLALYAAITTDTTTAGEIIDTRDFNPGVYFTIAALVFTLGSFALKLEHGDADDLADAEDVPSNMLVYGSLPVLTAATAAGGKMAREGVFSTKRYLRASIVSTGGADGTILACCVKEAQSIPTDQI